MGPSRPSACLTEQNGNIQSERRTTWKSSTLEHPDTTGLLVCLSGMLKLTVQSSPHFMYFVLFRCTPSARYTILFSHGNAVDLGQMSSFYLGLGTRINCNIFSYDYSGYGMSTGKPSEKNLYADVDAAWHALRTRYGISPENVILYGQSIGTVPTVDLASR